LSSSLAIPVLLNGYHYFSGFPIDFDGGFGANDGTHRTACTALPRQVRWMVALGSDTFLIQGNYFRRAGDHTQLATLAEKLIDFYPSLNGHSYLLIKMVLKKKTGFFHIMKPPGFFRLGNILDI
jgi:hypothetical protein